MSIWKERPTEDVETERARLMARADARGHEEMVRRLQRNATRQERIEARRLRRVERQQLQKERAQRFRIGFDAIRQRLILILPLLGVNTLALIGQIGFATKHFHWTLPEAVLFGAVLESIAVYIGWHAHQALLSGDSAIKLRASSYLMGAIVGGLNYDHFAGKGWKPTALSVVFGLMSLSSPWLWAMHGRYANRKRLRELGLVDERAPHFAGGRWVHFPVQTWGALRWGIAHNVQDPARAWDGYQAARRIRVEEKDGRPEVRVTVVRTVVQTVRPPKTTLRLYRVDRSSVQAVASTNDQAPTTNQKTVATTPPRGLPAPATTPPATSDHMDATTSSDHRRDRTRPQQKTTRKTGRNQADATTKPQPTPEDNKRAVVAYLASVKAGRPLSKRALAKKFGFSPTWALARIQEAGPRPVGGGDHPGDRVDATTPKDHPATTVATSEVKTG